MMGGFPDMSMTRKANCSHLWRPQDTPNNPRKTPNHFPKMFVNLIISKLGNFVKICVPTFLKFANLLCGILMILAFGTLELRAFEILKLWNFDTLGFCSI